MSTPLAPLPRPSDATAASSDDTIDALDVLLTLLENLKWLILWPVLGGLLAYGLAFLLPQKYESTAIIKADGSIAANMTASHVLDAALKNLGYVDGLSEADAEQAREDLSRNISTSVIRGTQLVSLTVAARSPQAAHGMTQEILKLVYVDSRPREAELRRLNSEKATLEQQAAELAAASKTAQQLLEQPVAGTDIGALAESVAALSSNVLRVQTAIHAVERKIDGLSDEDLVQAPTLPKRPSAPRKGVIAAVTAVTIGLFVLVFVLMLRSWRVSRTLDLHAERLAALKRNLHLG